MIGTIVNSIVVIIGCLIGFIVKGRLKQNISSTIMSGLGLCVLYIGISGALKGEDTLLMIICIVVGALIGELIDIDSLLNRLGEIVGKKVNKGSKNNLSIAEGFVTASLLFCVGAMAIVGSLESGLRGNHDTLFAKSILDKEPNAVEKYVGFLKSGGSDYPIEILKKAGVDMTTSKPLEATINRFNELLDMLEKEI